MKKLLLCILSLMLCLNTSVIHAKEPESLMIVAPMEITRFYVLRMETIKKEKKNL